MALQVKERKQIRIVKEVIMDLQQRNMGGAMMHIPSPFVAYHRERLRTGINPETGEPLTR